MKFLAVAALVAGVFAVPAPASNPNSCSPSSPPGNHGGDYNPPAPTPWHKGDNDYPPPNDGGSTTPHHGGDGNGDDDNDNGNDNGGDGDNDNGNDNDNDNDNDNGGSGGHGDDNLCPGLLYSNPQCCSVAILGVADLDCKTPNKTPKDAKDFQKICEKDGGKKAQCCVLPLLGQDLLCKDVTGAN